MRRRVDPRSAMLRIPSAAFCLAAVVWAGCREPEGRAGDTESPPAGGEFEARFRTARALLLDAIEDGATPAAHVLKAFRELSSERPEDARVVAYLGSLRLLDARAAVLPWQKGTAAVEGLELLDRAVALAPESLEVCFVRGRSSLPLPSFFGRAEAATRDILHVADRAADGVREGRIEPFLAAAALLAKGDLLERRGDREGAVASWRPRSRRTRALATAGPPGTRWFGRQESTVDSSRSTGSARHAGRPGNRRRRISIEAALGPRGLPTVAKSLFR